MLNRSAILTLAAIAAIGTTALTSTGASAARPAWGTPTSTPAVPPSARFISTPASPVPLASVRSFGV